MPDKKRVEVQLDEEDHNKLLALCRKFKTTIAELIRRLIREKDLTIFVLFLALLGCVQRQMPVDDTAMPTPTPTPVPSPTPTIVPMPLSITASQVFTNIAETWTFQNGFGDLIWIDVIPVDDTHSVWHYRKNANRAYWAPNVPSAELYFFLEKDSTGAWYSTGGRIIMPFGCPWCTPNPSDPVDFTYAVNTIPGYPRPYLILANSGTSVETIFPDADNPQARWATNMYVGVRLQEMFLVSEQWELSCGHERWWFKPGRGLWMVEPLDQGSCVDVDPLLNMVRID